MRVLVGFLGDFFMGDLSILRRWRGTAWRLVRLDVDNLNGFTDLFRDGLETLFLVDLEEIARAFELDGVAMRGLGQYKRGGPCWCEFSPHKNAFGSNETGSKAGSPESVILSCILGETDLGGVRIGIAGKGMWRRAESNFPP